MTNPKLLPTRCIVDRTVLVKLLASDIALRSESGFGTLQEGAIVERIRNEVESGQRVELYEKDWPESGRAGKQDTGAARSSNPTLLKASSSP